MLYDISFIRQQPYRKSQGWNGIFMPYYATLQLRSNFVGSFAHMVMYCGMPSVSC